MANLGEIGPIVRGDTATLRLWATRANGTREILNDKRIWFTAKRHPADTVGVITKGLNVGGLSGISVITPAAGELGVGGEVAIITITSADTAALPDYTVRLVWQAKMAPAAGDPQTPWQGTLTVEPDVVDIGP